MFLLITTGQCSVLRLGRVLVDSGQAAPSNAVVIDAALTHGEEYAVVNASFILALADFIPLKFH